MKAMLISRCRYPALLLLLLSATNVSMAPVAEQDTLPPECIAPKGGYFIPPSRVVGSEAAEYCQSLGGRLVDVSNNNVNALTAIVNKCIGGNKNVRIQTWDTNDFGTYDLVLHSGMLPGAGTVSTAGQGDELFAICQMAPPDFLEDDNFYTKETMGNKQPVVNTSDGAQVPAVVPVPDVVQVTSEAQTPDETQIPDELESEESIDALENEMA